MTALEIKGLWKEYGSQVVLENVGLSIASRAFVALVGPSGCGRGGSVLSGAPGRAVVDRVVVIREVVIREVVIRAPSSLAGADGGLAASRTACDGSAAERVLVEAAMADDDWHVRALVGQQREIVERVAVDHDQVAERAFRQHAGLILKAAEPGRDRGGGIVECRRQRAAPT